MLRGLDDANTRHSFRVGPLQLDQTCGVGLESHQFFPEAFLHVGLYVVDRSLLRNRSRRNWPAFTFAARSEPQPRFSLSRGGRAEPEADNGTETTERLHRVASRFRAQQFFLPRL